MNLTSSNCIIIKACRCIPGRRLEYYLQRLSCASPDTVSKNDCCIKIMNTSCLHCHYNGWVLRAHVIFPWDLVQYLLFHRDEVYCYHIQYGQTWSWRESKLVRVCMEVMMPISKNISLYLIFKFLKIVSWYFPRAEALYFSTFLFFGLLALLSYRPLSYKDKWV